VSYPADRREARTERSERDPGASSAGPIGRSADEQPPGSISRSVGVGQIGPSLGHELNNILTALLGWTEIARQEGVKRETLEGALEVIEKNARRARDIAARLLNASAAGERKREPVVLGEAVEDVLALLSLETRGAAIEVTRHIDSVEPCLADPIGLSQIFINIVRNAIEAMPDGGALAVTVRQLDERLEAVFTDSGPGISPQAYRKMFEPFFTTKKSDPPAGATGGAGLGLAICREIVEDHGGTIEVENAPQGGARFIVALPIIGADEADIGGASTRSSVPPGIRVLVVDDERDIGEMVRTALELRGAEVAVATSGSEALQLCGQQPFDAAFVDYLMPGLSGSDLVDELRAALPQLLIVFMSGRELDREALPAVADVLKKPFDLHDVRSKLHDVLDRG
jgi:CheY-like chemotaxis protein